MKSIRFLAAARHELLAETLYYSESKTGLGKQVLKWPGPGYSWITSDREPLKIQNNTNGKVIPGTAEWHQPVFQDFTPYTA
jgi:hypothetical protein